MTWWLRTVVAVLAVVSGACSSVSPEVTALSEKADAISAEKVPDDDRVSSFVDEALAVAERLPEPEDKFWALYGAMHACSDTATYERAHELRERVWNVLFPLTTADHDRESNVLILFGWAIRSSPAELVLEDVEFRRYSDELAARTKSTATRAACWVSQIQHLFGIARRGVPLSEGEHARAAALVSMIEEHAGDLDGFWRHDIYERIVLWRNGLMKNMVGTVAAEIEGEDLDGVRFRLSDYLGKVVVLDFWGFWCGHCRAMIPHLRSLGDNLKDRPFALVGVNSDEDRAATKAALQNAGVNWRSFWNGPKGPAGPIAAAWGVEAWPTVVVLDAKGVVRFRGVRGDALERAVAESLAEIAPGESK